MKRRLMQQAAEAEAAKTAQMVADTGNFVSKARFPLFSHCPHLHLHIHIFSYGAGDRHVDALWQLQSTLGAALPVTTALEEHTVPYWPMAGASDTLHSEAEPQKERKWKTALDDPFKFDFGVARPHRDLAGIRWDTGLKGVVRSEAGAEGVFFVDSVDGAFVVKGSRSLAAEAFASLVSCELGVYTPPWRIVAMAGG